MRIIVFDDNDMVIEDRSMMSKEEWEQVKKILKIEE